MTTQGWPPQQPPLNWPRVEPPAPKRPWYTRKRYVFPIIGVSTLFLIGLMNSSTPDVAVQPGSTAEAAAPTAQTVALADLIADFDRNQVAAERKWNDRAVQVGGTIENISEDVIGNPFLTFRSPTTQFLATSVKCSLVDEDQAMNLVNGQKVEVVGVVDGQVFGVIGLSQCRVVR